MGFKSPRLRGFIFDFDLQIIGCFFPFLDASDEGVEVVLIGHVGEQYAAG